MTAGASGQPTLLVCAPLGIEAAALRTSLGWSVVRRTGYGLRRSARSAAYLAHWHFDAMAVAGLAGGLDGAVSSGDIVVASEVRGQRTVLPCPGAEQLAGALRETGATVHCGPIVTVQHIVGGAERPELAASGALAVDMESAALAVAAGDRPLAVLRVVVDTPHQPLLSPGTPCRALRALRRLRSAGPCLNWWARQATSPPPTHAGRPGAGVPYGSGRHQRQRHNLW